ncbi:Borealin N terminal-domain-containing protein [Yarrowia lipolytica]|nr:Borealin N terminal-domain-containing protein [Yarrowia lipolytica]KAJ8054828.1 Borealin N terminal-domain-containing protein [Yarrowia lipolytica]
MPTEMDQFPSNMARKPLTEVQKNDLIENLQLELTNRIERLKSQYQFAAQAVRAKIEIRKTRVPKRYWNKTLREVQALQDGALKDRKPNKLNFGQGFHNIPKFTIPHE